MQCAEVWGKQREFHTLRGGESNHPAYGRSVGSVSPQLHTSPERTPELPGRPSNGRMRGRPSIGGNDELIGQGWGISAKEAWIPRSYSAVALYSTATPRISVGVGGRVPPAACGSICKSQNTPHLLSVYGCGMSRGEFFELCALTYGDRPRLASATNITKFYRHG